MTQVRVAEMFGIHQTTVSNIQREKTWTHIKDLEL